MLLNSDDDKEAVREEVRQLVKETNAPKSADELLAAYAGREDELVAHLRKMKAKQGVSDAEKDEIRSLVEKTQPGKSADELLAAYAGREGELLKNLKKMDSKKSVTESQKEEIRSLWTVHNPERVLRNCWLHMRAGKVSCSRT